MFDFLKKKLKETKEKFVEAVKKKEVKEDPIIEQTKPEIQEDKIEEVVKQEIPKIEQEVKKIEEIAERIEEVKEEKKETILINNIEEPIPEVHKETNNIEPVPEIKESKIEAKKETKEKKKFSLFKKKEKLDHKEIIEKLKEEPKTPIEEVKVLQKEVEIVSKPEPVKEEPKKLTFGTKLKRAFSSDIELTQQDIEPILQDLQMGLLESDVAYDVTEKISLDLKLALTGSGVKKTDIDTFIEEKLKESILSLFSEAGSMDLLDKVKEFKNKNEPLLIAFIGTNGSGKTTSLAKIAQYLKNNGYSSVLAAGDTFRAASIEQLEEHGKRLGIPVIKHSYGSDSAAVIFDAVQHAKARGVNVVLADTAGRSHTNINLMDELHKVVRVNKPHIKILVVDSLTGNEAVEQAIDFNKAVSIDAVVLTKTDVNPKGGAALSVSYMLKRPILFMGLGQEYKDLVPFEAKSFVNNLFS